MKTRLLSALAALAAVLTVIGSLDLSGILPILPDKVALFLATMLPSLAAVAHVINIFGDAVDDGKMNGSWKAKLIPMSLWLGLGLSCLPLASCAAVMAAATGEPIPTTEVRRTDGTGRPFQVATADVTRAEARPDDTAWGLYDAGAAAARAREVISSSGK